jgi:hypothetical protein
MYSVWCSWRPKPLQQRGLLGDSVRDLFCSCHYYNMVLPLCQPLMVLYFHNKMNPTHFTVGGVLGVAWDTTPRTSERTLKRLGRGS